MAQFFFFLILSFFYLAASPSFDQWIDKKDSSIDLYLLNLKSAKDLGVENFSKMDPGFKKWLLSFQEIPGNPPYKIQESRPSLARKKLSEFHDVKLNLKSSDLSILKYTNHPLQFMVSSRGYLRGEKVVFRISSRDPALTKEISFYPRPMVLRKSSGEVLMRASLKHGLGDVDMYLLDFCGVKEGETYTYRCVSGNERMEVPMEGSAKVYMTPGVVDLEGGVCRLEIQLKSGEICKMSFPWGTELLKYHSGAK